VQALGVFEAKAGGRTVDDFGRPGVMIEPRQGMWVAREDIDALFVIEPPGG
jgi:hypothetical protein